MSEGKETQQEAPDIVRIDPREHVRKRPGMYIGGTDAKAMQHLIELVIDNSAELASRGQCNHVWITLRDNNEVSIGDNGTEIPTEIEESTGKPYLEAYMTQLGMSNKRAFGFPNELVGPLDRLGPWVVNALSEWLSIETTYNGLVWRQEHQEGIPQTSVTQIRPLNSDETRGITITFRPDRTIFQSSIFNYEAIVERSREIAYCVPNLNITVTDERETPSITQHIFSADGMRDLVVSLTSGQQPLHTVISGRGFCEVGVGDQSTKIEVDCAIQYVDSMDTVIKTYVNTIPVFEGTHLRGFEAALLKLINEKQDRWYNTPFTWNEICARLVAAISLKHPSPSFMSKQQSTLINDDAFWTTATVVYEIIRKGMAFVSWDTILDKCEANRRALGGG